MEAAAFPFRVRGVDGRVHVSYGVNDDPSRWGFHLLGLDFDLEVARGFPVIEARVEYPAEGYAAYLGWIQLVRYLVDGQTEPTVILDVAPQLKDARMPYLSFGVRPVLFDAPAISEQQNVVWRAWSFLTSTPDCLMTPSIEPACGFRWGYDVRAGVPAPAVLLEASREDWLDVREELRARLPEWTFGEGGWGGLDPMV